MEYIVNPKTKGSGILACIPQKGRCPNNCKHCFFQGHGRSFLKPIEENTPNMPLTDDTFGRVVRVNDGNDSNNYPNLVKDSVKFYPHKFFNTSIPTNLEFFEDPVVLTINPGEMTDKEFYKLNPIPKNLMFVRIRANMWNIWEVVIPAVKYYTEREVPVVLTFMAYYQEGDKIPDDIKVRKFYDGYNMVDAYVFRQRTLNSYWAITTVAWEFIMEKFKYNHWLYSCSKIEGEKGTYKCHRCGNCLREYFYTMEKIRGSEF